MKEQYKKRNKSKHEIVKAETQTPATLDDSFSDIAKQVITETDPEKLQNLYARFKANSKKKDLIRVIKLSGLLGSIEDEAIKRVEQKPDEIPDKELLDYLQIISNQIERAQKSIDNTDDKPTVEVNKETHTNIINIGGINLDDESKSKVLDVFNDIMKDIKNTAAKGDVIDAEVVETNTQDTKDE